MNSIAALESPVPGEATVAGRPVSVLCAVHAVTISIASIRGCAGHHHATPGRISPCHTLATSGVSYSE